MSSRPRRTLVAFLLAPLLAAPARAQTAAPSPDAAAIDRLVRAQVDSGFSGVVLVADGDAVVLHRAYGRGAGARAPLDTGSAFWIASMTKGFTAAAVLQLAAAGRLSVDDTLARFFPDAPADKRAIALRQLLTHTAGFPAAFAGAGHARRADAVRAILAGPLAYAPGRGYRYGDDDYTLLAAVVETVTHRRWEDVVADGLLRPVGLRHTGFWCSPRAGVPHPVAGADGARSTCRGTGDWGHRGANGMSSTASDLLRWSRALARGPVPDASVRAALAAPRVLVRREPPADVHYGYGARIYVVAGRTAEVMHSGSGDDGHTGVVRALASGRTIVVLSDAGPHAGTTWSAYVARQLGARD